MVQSNNQNVVSTELAQAIDAMLVEACPPDAPGAVVIVARDGNVVFRKGYGMANLELGVPIAPEMVFRLGSITKQFTAVAILMLVEQGKLALEDDITRFLPDYPTQGHTITVEHLLTHTSGIKSYTSMPEWLALRRNDLTVEELIDLFKDQPMEFAPGERWAYNNSGYVLAGAIIEKVSGQTYEQFLEQQIFEPLGMARTCYDRTARIVPGRVAGYDRSDEGFENAAYLSMTHPYAAGALMSSVDDLQRWDEALFAHRVVKPESLQCAHTPFVLNDGTSTGYGYGWGIGTYEGHAILEHGGGINGFLTFAIHLPEDRVYVAVLTNTTANDRSPDQLAIKIAAEVIGVPYRERETIMLDLELLDACVGVYEIYEGEEAIVTREGDRLFIQRTGGSRDEVFPVSPAEFCLKHSSYRFTFRKNAAGEVIEVEGRGRTGPAQVGKKTDKPLPQPREPIALDPAVYDQYTGTYALGSDFSLTVSREGDQLMAQIRGQPKIQIFPESPTAFFLKDVDARIEFVQDESGKVTGVVLHQWKQQLAGKKIA